MAEAVTKTKDPADGAPPTAECSSEQRHLRRSRSKENQYDHTLNHDANRSGLRNASRPEPDCRLFTARREDVPLLFAGLQDEVR
jgi:hypothetical protein